MYEVLVDGKTLYKDGVDDLMIVNPQLTLELNKAGSFSFTIYPNHPMYDNLHKINSRVVIYQNEKVIFKGRILSDEKDFILGKTVTCEGELAYLNDSIVRPYDASGEEGEVFTIRRLLEFYLNQHNSQVEDEKKFYVGNVTVKDKGFDTLGRINNSYDSCWTNIYTKLLEELGGYLQIRYENGIRYLDYLADVGELSNQEVTFGFNLLDVNHSISGEEIATCIIPLGAENDEGEKLTIVDINDGKDYLLAPQEILNVYGIITKVIEWDWVVTPELLKEMGEEYLNDSMIMSETIELTAIDLARINKDISSFCLGDKIKVYSMPHSLSGRTYILSKLEICFTKPDSNKLTLGDTFKTLSLQNIIQNQTINVISSSDVEIKKDINSTNKRVEKIEEKLPETVAGVYTGKDLKNLEYPIGTYLMDYYTLLELFNNTGSMWNPLKINQQIDWIQNKYDVEQGDPLSGFHSLPSNVEGLWAYRGIFKIGNEFTKTVNFDGGEHTAALARVQEYFVLIQRVK